VPAGGAPESPMERQLADAFLREEVAGLRLAMWGRLAALAVLMPVVAMVTPAHNRLYYMALMGLFAVLAIAAERLLSRAPGRLGLHLALLAVEFLLIAWTLLVPNPWSPVPHPPPMQLRYDVVAFLFVLLAGAAFSYRPAIMAGAGLAAVLAWALGHLWLLSLPGVLTERDMPPGAGLDAQLRVFLDPNFVSTDVWLQDSVVLLVVAGLLALLVRRSRRLVERQARAALERANLARYFPPGTVERLADGPSPFAAMRDRPVAVLFADLVGFTATAERLPAERLMALLRAVHAGLEEAVFRHDGTLDKFLGDGVMATFGTAARGPRDALNALAAARDMLAHIDRLNATGEGPPLRLVVGLHYGPAVIGDIGGERRLELAVLGDVVNVASRLEELTRETGAAVLASDALVAEARRSDAAEAQRLLAGFEVLPPLRLRGRTDPVAAWRLPQQSAAPVGSRP